MSGFLANLVRRSVGLAPMTIVRPIGATTDVDRAAIESDQADGDVESLHHAAPAAAPLAIEPPPPATIAVPHDAPAPVVSQPIAATAAPLVQRFVQSATPAPMVIAVAPMPPATSPVAAISPETVSRGDEGPQLSPAPVAGNIGSEGAVTVHATHILQTWPADAGVSPREVAAVMEPPPIEHLIPAPLLVEPPREGDRAVLSDPGPLPVTPLPPMPQPLAETAVMPERVVHVRIGAIEIHGAPAPVFAAATAAPAPASIAPSGEGGFDRYERLRSYAAWER